MSHTPGTWEVGYGGGLTGPRVAPTVYLDDTETIEIPIRVGKAAVAWVLTSRGDGREEADARLIAAAPALLSALEDLLEDYLRDMPDIYPDAEPEDFSVVKAARAAIAKATGESK